MPTSPAVPWARLSLKAVLVPRTGAAGSQGARVPGDGEGIPRRRVDDGEGPPGLARAGQPGGVGRGFLEAIHRLRVGAHHARIARCPGNHHDRKVVVSRAGLCAGQLALWRSGERRVDRAGHLRPEGLARNRTCTGDYGAIGAGQRSDTCGACLAPGEPGDSCSGSSLEDRPTHAVDRLSCRLPTQLR